MIELMVCFNYGSHYVGWMCYYSETIVCMSTDDCFFWVCFVNLIGCKRMYERGKVLPLERARQYENQCMLNFIFLPSFEMCANNHVSN